VANDSEILLLAIEQFLDEHRREGGLRGRSYDTGLVLLVAARLGPNVELIAERLDLEESFVQSIAVRMRARLWDDVRVSTEGWFDDQCFPGFYEDLAVAEGLSIRVTTDEGICYLGARETSSSVM
jgi:hypothetical protein